MSFISTVSTISERKVALTSSRLSYVELLFVVTLRFVKSILFSKDLAYGIDSIAGPPYLASLVLSNTVPTLLATAITIVVFIAHP